MPQLTFPLVPDGLVVDVRVNVAGPTMRSALAAGRVPLSVATRGLIDTGTDITAVAPAVLQQAGVGVYHPTATQGIGGSVPTRLCLVTLFVLDAGRPHLPWLVVPDLLVMELQSFAFDRLIGLDVLRTRKLLVDGPAASFTLEWL
jgi:hypothetical protein